MRGRASGKRALAAAILAAAALLAVAGCGDGEGEEEPAGQDLTAVQCPMEQTGEVDGVPRYEPAENAFDTAELIGLDLNDARNKAIEHGCEVVVSIEDGEGIPVPIEIEPTRVYVYVEDGAVTFIEGVGGGI